LPGAEEQSAIRRDALREYSRVEAEIARLRSAAEKETQIPRQVELNLEIKRCQAALNGSINKINAEPSP
jgi:hypothetical protein